jgi:hypothetical protein
MGYSKSSPKRKVHSWKPSLRKKKIYKQPNFASQETRKIEQSPKLAEEINYYKNKWNKEQKNRKD